MFVLFLARDQAPGKLRSRVPASQVCAGSGARSRVNSGPRQYVPVITKGRVRVAQP